MTTIRKRWFFTLAAVVLLTVAVFPQQPVNVVNATIAVVQNVANWTINLVQVNGTTIDTNSGSKSAGTIRVIPATDSLAIALWGHGATGAAVPANATYIGGVNSAGLAGPIFCNNTAKYDASTTGSTQLVALSGSTTIYVCAYEIMVGSTATNVKLVYGTGSNCGTGSTDITPAWPLLANAGKVYAPPFWNGLKTASANALCSNASAANAVQVLVYYTQF